MRFKLILIILGIILPITGKSQVLINKSQVDFSLSIEQDSIYRILTFWKDIDSITYHSVKYTISDFNQNQNEKNLKDEIIFIQRLWEIAEDSIQFDLESFNIGYPLQYSDILKNHINAFHKSKDWQIHLSANGKKLDYEIIKKLMLENDVYKPLNAFLNTKGYVINSFYTEKHGFVTEENLHKAGFSRNEVIPMPFIIWAKLEKH